MVTFHPVDHAILAYRGSWRLIPFCLHYTGDKVRTRDTCHPADLCHSDNALSDLWNVSLSFLTTFWSPLIFSFIVTAKTRLTNPVHQSRLPTEADTGGEFPRWTAVDVYPS